MLAQVGAHARDQHGEAERLGDVVVGAGFEAHHLVGLAVVAGQHDDRVLEAAAAQRLDRVAPVHVGQADVHQHEVRPLLQGAGDRALRVPLLYGGRNSSSSASCSASAARRSSSSSAIRILRTCMGDLCCPGSSRLDRNRTVRNKPGRTQGRRAWEQGTHEGQGRASRNREIDRTPGRPPAGRCRPARLARRRPPAPPCPARSAAAGRSHGKREGDGGTPAGTQMRLLRGWYRPDRLATAALPGAAGAAAPRPSAGATSPAPRSTTAPRPCR